MLAPRVSCRLFQPGDFDGLRHLWESETDWGPIDPLFHHWHRDNPCPGSVTVLAVDADAVVGHLSFVAMPISVAGRRVRAARATAPIVGSRLRERANGGVPTQAIAELLDCATTALRAQGHSLMFGLPREGFARLFPTFPCERFPLWSLPLPLDQPLPLGCEFRATPLTDWDPRVDALWEKALQLHACAVARDSRTLRWKTAGLDLLGVERNEELAGIVASGPKGEKPRQWEICDLVTADLGDALDATLRAAVNLGHAHALSADNDQPIRQVALLVTPALERAASELGFQRDAWDFPIMVGRLDETLTDEAVAPSRWYLSAND